MPKRKITEGDLALKFGDYHQLNKMLNKHGESVVDGVNNYVDFCTESLTATLWVVTDLLCVLLEKAGINPLEASSLLLARNIYLHASMESDIPGISVEMGRVYRDGKPVEDARYKYLYFAKGKDVHFGDAYNKTFGLSAEQMENGKEQGTVNG